SDRTIGSRPWPIRSSGDLGRRTLCLGYPQAYERMGKGQRRVRGNRGCHDLRTNLPSIDGERCRGGAMASGNIETHRAGHEAFNQRDFEAMTKHYEDSISWTDHSQGRTFATRQEFRDDFLPGWVRTSSDIRITDPHYIDA